MEPLHQFIIDFETFLTNNGYELSTDLMGDLNLTKDGKLVGYWSGRINAENFEEMK